MKITFLLSSLSQALSFQRVQALARLGAQTEVFGFERDACLQARWQDRYTSLGPVAHRRYGGRTLRLLKALPTVRAAARETDVLYTTTLDMLFLGWLASRGLAQRPLLVYDVFDIRDVLLGQSRSARLLRRFECTVVKDVDHLVVTSPAYATEYFRGVQELHHLSFQVIENKLDARQLPPVRREVRPPDGPLRIGYFGNLRCRRSWQILQEAARLGNGRVHVYVRGIPRLEDLPAEAGALPYVDYGGPYVSPQDLPELYEQVDMVWAVYQFGERNVGNWRWARTHRFYESCFFRKPMFTQSNSEDGRIAERHGLGPVLDLRDFQGSLRRVLRIGRNDVVRWQQNILQLPDHTFVYGDEYGRLLATLDGKRQSRSRPVAPPAELSVGQPGLYD